MTMAQDETRPKRQLSHAELRQRQQAALKHGVSARSPNALKQRSHAVRYLVRTMKKAMPWLTASDNRMLTSWAELEVAARMLYNDLETYGWHNPKTGEPRRVLSEFRQMRLACLAYAKELGCTPAARAQLGALISGAREADLASELAQIRLEKARRKPKDVTPRELPSDAS